VAEFCVRLEVIKDVQEGEDIMVGEKRMDMIVEEETAELAVAKAVSQLFTNTPVRARVFLLEECRRYDVNLVTNIEEVKDW
jgi:hypothetical protein